MADEDNFDIDIYGDEEPEVEKAQAEQPADGDNKANNGHAQVTIANGSGYGESGVAQEESGGRHGENGVKQAQDYPQHQQDTTMTSETQDVTHNSNNSVKPEETNDRIKDDETNAHSKSEDANEGYDGYHDQSVDANASQAVIVNGMQWWVNDDDVRGWARFAGAEDDLRDITFGEHKVNGKCKG